MNFFEKLNNAIAINQSLLIVGLDPNPEMMPHDIRINDTKNPNKIDINLDINLDLNSTKKWLVQIIKQTSDLVCAYKPTLGFYQALGAKGIELLREIIEVIPEEIPIILDAKHGDLNTSRILAKTFFQQWQIDAITINPYAGQEVAIPFLIHPDRGVFVLCHTSNPDAIVLQKYPNADNPFYLQVVKEVKSWGTPENLFLEVGTSSPEIIGKIRSLAPERTILIRSIWGENNNIERILKFGLDKNGQGLLIPIPQDLLAKQDFTSDIKSLKEEVNTIRNQVIQQGCSCQLWMPDVCFLNKHSHQDLILQIYDLGCILFGEYLQASGATFSYYIDLRKIISNPQVFHQVLIAYESILKPLEFDRIAGIPYGSLPTATGLSLNINCPMIYPRKEVKAHGTQRLIEGHFNPGEKVVVIDDIIISGNSVMKGIDKLKSAGLKVEDIVVFISHEDGVEKRVEENGYKLHSVLTISDINSTLFEAGKINEEQFLCLSKNH